MIYVQQSLQSANTLSYPRSQLDRAEHDEIRAKGDQAGEYDSIYHQQMAAGGKHGWTDGRAECKA